jgi:predicted XRE-type DNA-binding protein
MFADLGYADAEERQTKLRLAHAINSVVARRRLTQAAAAEKLNINRPKVSALANYKLHGFPVARLMTFLTALDQDVEIVIRRKPRCGLWRGFRSWRPESHVQCHPQALVTLKESFPETGCCMAVRSPHERRHAGIRAYEVRQAGPPLPHLFAHPGTC